MMVSFKIVFLVKAASFLSADTMEEVECSHYRRHCKIFCTKCDTAWSCRICHNEANSSHEIDRFAVVKISCNKCETVQDKQSKCTNCGIEFGKYSCLICSMFDDNEKGQFHCDGCGLCRTRGRENFIHCDLCGFCLHVSNFDEHTCVEGASKNNCNICQEFMHDSRDTLFVPRCLHLVHHACAKAMVNDRVYTCSICESMVLIV